MTTDKTNQDKKDQHKMTPYSKISIKSDIGNVDFDKGLAVEVVGSEVVIYPVNLGIDELNTILKALGSVQL